MDLWTLLGDIVMLLGACLLVGGLFSRFGQSPLVGYLFAGMLLGGPGSIHVIGSQHEIESIAELGVALLLFSLGLEFSIGRLKKLGRRPLVGGMIQVILTIVLASIAALAFGLSFKASIAFGAMISLSSTAVVLRLLLERSELEMPHGRNSLAVLLIQDIAVVPLALLMTLLGGEGTMVDMALSVVKLLLSGVVLVVGLFLLNKLSMLALGTLTLNRNRELTVIFAVVTGLGAAWTAHYAGISPALGAFVAGMMLGSSVFATQIRADISSLRVVLLTLFFGAAGMVADPVWIVNNLSLVVMVSALLTVGKLLIIWGIFQALGHSIRVSLATGICLAQVGEFAFVLGSIGRTSGVVTEELYALTVSVTIVSFILSALLVPAAPWIGNLVAEKFGEKPESSDGETKGERIPDVLIIGFGPAGQNAARSLIDQHSHVVVIDLNHDSVRKAQLLGFKGVIGDATQHEVLEHAQINQAKAIIITIPHLGSAMTVLENVRHQAPHVYVFVRSRYQIHSSEFASAGAHVVVGDEEQVGESLAEEVSRWYGAAKQQENEAASADNSETTTQ